MSIRREEFEEFQQSSDPAAAAVLMCPLPARGGGEVPAEPEELDDVVSASDRVEEIEEDTAQESKDESTAASDGEPSEATGEAAAASDYVDVVPSEQ